MENRKGGDRRQFTNILFAYPIDRRLQPDRRLNNIQARWLGQAHIKLIRRCQS